MNFFKFCIIFLAATVLSGCQAENQEEAKKELLIYCGITMIRPMQVIASMVEKEKNCIFKITKQGSGALLNSLRANGVGDLYLPGSESYMQKALEEGLVTETAEVGFNQAALIVQKGNPLHITPEVNNLIDPKYRVVLGSPESGSIGRETERILSRICIYQQALNNTLFLTADSKGMTQAIRDNNADLALNWYATAKAEENIPFLDALPLDEDMAPPHKLVLGLLKFSPYPDIARRFIEIASSEQGQTIFKTYGFGAH